MKIFNAKTSWTFVIVLTSLLTLSLAQQMMSAITHALNMLKSCENYRPDMNRIFFRYFDRNGKNYFTTNCRANNATGTCGVRGSEAYSFIIPGWRQNCKHAYVKRAIDNLHTYRGGCVICMDYIEFSFTDNYRCLFNRFAEVRETFYLYLKLLAKNQVRYEDIYIFGHSFGSQVALQASRMLGYKAIGGIDACDPAGIFFDSVGIFKTYLNAKKPIDVSSAAKTVDCWHTSVGYGTTNRFSCDRNWLLGKCGVRQVAANRNITSHQLCPIFYNLSFKYAFLATQNPVHPICHVSVTKPARFIPEGFKLGYRERRKKLVYGQIFVNTSRYFPYN